MKTINLLEKKIKKYEENAKQYKYNKIKIPDNLKYSSDNKNSISSIDNKNKNEQLGNKETNNENKNDKDNNNEEKNNNIIIISYEKLCD